MKDYSKDIQSLAIGGVHKYTIRIDPLEMARQLAGKCNHTQAAFINQFGHALKLACGSKHNAEVQLCYVEEELDEDGLWWIGFLREPDNA